VARPSALQWHAAVDGHVGSRLRERRAQLRMSQRTLAAAVGCTYQQVRKYELGINCISGGRLYMIAAALAVPISFFFEGLPAAATMTFSFAGDHAAAEAAIGKKARARPLINEALPDPVRGFYRKMVGPVVDDTKGYRLYFLDAAGRISGIHSFQAQDDETAQRIADRLYGACSDLCASFELRQESGDLIVANASLCSATAAEQAATRSQEMLIRREEPPRESAIRVAKGAAFSMRSSARK